MPCRILLAVDGSSFSDAASRVALQLAVTLGESSLHALHVVNVLSPSGNLLKDIPGRLGFEPAVVKREIGEQHEERGRQILEGLERDGQVAGVEVKSTLDRGAVVDRIVHHARLADLLVMGLRGETEDRFPGQGGSALDAVLQRVRTPVLFVPQGAAPISRIALGYDGSSSATHTIAAIRRLFAGSTVEVHAIYIGDAEEGARILAQVDGALPDLSVQHHVANGDQVHVALAAEANRLGADVLAVGFRGHSPLKDFLYGTATSFILSSTHLSVLVAH